MHKKSCLRFLIIISFLFGSNLLCSQNVDINNLQNINVDDLTDEQVQNFASEVKKRGLTEQQLEILAKSRGMSSFQIAKLRQRIAVLELSPETTDRSSNVNRLRSDINESEAELNSLDLFGGILSDEADSEEGELKIYGLDFFANPNLTFTPSLNIPTPKKYVLGPGDQIFIDVWGASEQNYQLTISPEGKIIIPSIGPIYLAGLSVDEASKKVKSRLREIYSGIGNNTFTDFSLGQIRSININVVGEVSRPGTYTVSAFAGVLNALYYAGGPNENGSLRSIDVIRDGKLFNSVDVYELLSGEGYESIDLMDQDIVIVRPFIGRVTIEGEIKQPGIYEMMEEETLSKLLGYAGGFSDKAYRNNITIRRNQGLKKSIHSVPFEEFNAFKLRGGDEVLVSEVIQKFVNRVQISGAVNKEGEYELTKGLTLRSLLDKAEGLSGDAFHGRGVIIRMNEDYSLSTLNFNLREILNGSKDILLLNEDFVKIQSIHDLRDEYVVNVQGEVRSPGRYPFVDSMRVEDLIFLANGFKVSAARSFVEVARRVSSEGSSEYAAEIFSFGIDENLNLSADASDFIIQPFDLVVVRQSPNYKKQEIVEVEGEVVYPGKYSIEKKDERISDLLERAGGITEFGYVKGATLIRRTEYYVDEEDDSEAAKQRRENIARISQRDSLLSEQEFEIKTQESIGIELNEIINNPGSRFDLILKEGDILSIPKQLQTIRLRGELLYPSTVRYDKALSFKSYISQAGGFSDNAKKRKSYVVYANGSAERTKSFLWFTNYPDVEPGAEIIVPKKPERQPISAQAWIALASSATTIALAVQNLIR